MAGAERICIVGARGMLGRELVEACAAMESGVLSTCQAIDREEIDIADESSVRRVLDDLVPGVVINAAAYTDVDACERHEAEATAVNGHGPGHLAAWCCRRGARFVHVSTDFVFDGRKDGPYMPEDEVCPLSAYGRSKLEGERRVLAASPEHAVVRTSWLFGVHGGNFVKTILRLSRERGEISVVTDQVGRPTCARDLAGALLRLARTRAGGLFHFANHGACSWYTFAEEIVRLAGGTTRILPLTSDRLGRPAVRPAWSVLDTGRIERTLGIVPRHWKEALAECLPELLRPAAA